MSHPRVKLWQQLIATSPPTSSRGLFRAQPAQQITYVRPGRGDGQGSTVWNRARRCRRRVGILEGNGGRGRGRQGRGLFSQTCIPTNPLHLGRWRNLSTRRRRPFLVDSPCQRRRPQLAQLPTRSTISSAESFRLEIPLAGGPSPRALALQFRRRCDTFVRGPRHRAGKEKNEIKGKGKEKPTPRLAPARAAPGLLDWGRRGGGEGTMAIEAREFAFFRTGCVNKGAPRAAGRGRQGK
ncbi:hypothetical protein LZ30DRAFT_16184 [Colletotrichum cereale]|nr:hypothetical protein LZ30DRAFT_16184 [Colletotrichum cereale]